MSDSNVTRSPFPASDRVIYEHHTLAEVICQLRFPTILEIGASDPAAFQERIRDSYPLYEREFAAGIPVEIAEILNRLPVKGPVGQPSHRFSTADSKRFVSLTPDFVALTEQTYERWEQFSQELTRVQKALEEVYRPSFYNRIGLRYVNVIDKAELGLEGVSWSELVNSSLTGLLGASEIASRVKEISGRAVILIDDLVPDGAATVQHGLVVRDNERLAYHLDADFYTQERKVGADVGRILDVFHDLAGNLFRWSVSDQLRQALGPGGAK